MVQLIYASAAKNPFSHEDLHLLLSQARRRNGMLELSGILLYHTGSFLQVLEGSSNNIGKILNSIEQDPRHSRMKILLRVEIERREFGNWTMGFVDSGLAVAKPIGMVDYHRTLPGLIDASTRAGQYLRFFQNGLHRR